MLMLAHVHDQKVEIVEGPEPPPREGSLQYPTYRQHSIERPGSAGLSSPDAAAAPVIGGRSTPGTFSQRVLRPLVVTPPKDHLKRINQTV